MRIIFLDIDGVLNHVASLSMNVHMLPEKCLLLRQICEQANSKIVITSAWRNGSNTDDLGHLLWRCGVPYKAVISQTPDLEMPRTRGHEIEAWLHNHNEVSSYVILDDEKDFIDYQLRYFVKTDSRVGLLPEHVVRAVRILNEQHTGIGATIV